MEPWKRPLAHKHSMFINLHIRQVCSFMKGIILLLTILLPLYLQAQKLVPVGEGWANNSVNVTVFRKNSLVTHGRTQYIAYYSDDAFLVLGKRKLNSSNWELLKTQYQGNASDAHNSISLMVDGNGYLHVSWDHHGHPLRYAKSVKPNSLVLGKKTEMTGLNETNVTYPEFFKMPDGNLIFMYRDGSSGRGNMVINRYDYRTQKWQQVQQNLISGEDKRNAYWQAVVDGKGVIHVSWVWRESWLVETNHDMCYARSTDGGRTWENSKGEKYDLPITAQTAEYACLIPQNSELINQTSMAVDDKGNPYIASYWSPCESNIPQYHIIYRDANGWHTECLGFRTQAFSLKGGGTKRIPIARPQLTVVQKKNQTSLCLIFRDEERGSIISAAHCADLNNPSWEIEELTGFQVGAWEPSFDTELWRQKRKLHLFVQNTEQVDGEGKANVHPEMVYVLELPHKWKN